MIFSYVVKFLLKMSDFVLNSSIFPSSSEEQSISCDFESNSSILQSAATPSSNETNTSFSSTSTTPEFYVTKHKKGKPMLKGEKTIIHYLYLKICDENPQKFNYEIVKLVSNFSGVGVQSVKKIIREMKIHGNFQGIKITRPRKSIFTELSTSEKDSIRRIVHDFFVMTENPNLKKIQIAIEEDETLPQLKRTTLYRILTKLGFLFRSRKRNVIKTNSVELLNWREQHISTIRRYRREGRKLYFTDETWLNVNHSVKKIWEDTTVKTSREAFVQGLSTGLKDPSGKGKRLIITHIGSDSGFLDGGLLCFESHTNSADYHDDMNGEVYEDWFHQILSLLQPNRVVILDNAPYHSRKLEKIPHSGFKKPQIIEWLVEKNIPADTKMKKKELMEKVNEVRHLYDKYVIDEMARENGITVLRLPPYHCIFNPIELIWAQVR